MTEDTANIPGSLYVFPAYWGGVTRSSSPPMIHSKLRELRDAIGGFAAKKAAGGPSFPVRSAKELCQKLAQALQDLNLVAPVRAQEVTIMATDAIPDNKTASGKPVFRTLVHVKATVHIGAEDGSFVEVVGSGNGGDVDDKAGGKASTYAWKDAITKGVTIPEQDMLDTDDEAPSAEPEVRVKKVAAVADGQLEGVLARIAAADLEGLEVIKDEIKNGSIPLAGADKIKASSAFLARRKVLS